MKKMLIAVLMTMATLGMYSNVMADTLSAYYQPASHVLRVDFYGSRIPTWGCNDFEGVQWDRLILDDLNRAQVYLEFYDSSHPAVRLWVYRMPASESIAIWGTTTNVPCGTRFQIRFLAWVGNQQQWLYWPIGPGEPNRGEFNGTYVEIDYNGGAFITTCPP